MQSTLEYCLNQRLLVGNLRELRIVKDLHDFSSNDYLGLARSEELAVLTDQERNKIEGPLNGLSSTGSRLLTGNSIYAQNLEEQLATFHGFEAALLFNCGYMANLGLISAVTAADDVIFFDLHVHASMHDGLRLSKARVFPFRHNALNHLENQLKKITCKGKRFICIESIYSTDGSRAPLQEIAQLASIYNAHLIVDEAHAVGVWGLEGRGLVDKNVLQQKVFAQIVTFGKALGSYGAAVLGNETLKQFLINFSRSYIYSTALPLQVLASIQSSYQLFPGSDQKRRHLNKLIQMFVASRLTDSTTQIQCLKIPGNSAVRQAAKKLEEKGFDVRPLMSPTVKQGHEVLRICLHAFNTEEQVCDLIDHLKKITGEAVKNDEIHYNRIGNQCRKNNRFCHSHHLDPRKLLETY